MFHILSAFPSHPQEHIWSRKLSKLSVFCKDCTGNKLLLLYHNSLSTNQVTPAAVPAILSPSLTCEQDPVMNMSKCSLTFKLLQPKNYNLQVEEVEIKEVEVRDAD